MRIPYVIDSFVVDCVYAESENFQDMLEEYMETHTERSNWELYYINFNSAVAMHKENDIYVLFQGLASDIYVPKEIGAKCPSDPVERANDWYQIMHEVRVSTNIPYAGFALIPQKEVIIEKRPIGRRKTYRKKYFTFKNEDRKDQSEGC